MGSSYEVEGYLLLMSSDRDVDRHCFRGYKSRGQESTVYGLYPLGHCLSSRGYSVVLGKLYVHKVARGARVDQRLRVDRA